MSQSRKFDGTIIEWPRRFSLERYHEAVDTYSAWLAQDPGVLSVYQIGDVGAPGLSDIDLVVVLDPLCLKGKEFRFRRDFLPSDLQYLVMHDAVFLSESLFEQIFELLPVFDLQHRAGRVLKQPARPNPPSPFTFHVLLNDLAVISLSEEYKVLSRSKTLHLRNTIARINSLKYPLLMISSLGRPVQGAEEFEQAISKFRKQFFELDEKEVRKWVVSLLAFAEDIAARVLSELEYLNSQMASCYGEGTIHLSNGFRVKECSWSASKAGGLSPFHFAHLQIYADGTGPLSSYLRDCLKGEVAVESWESQYLHEARKRSIYLNEYHKFLNSCGVQLGRVFSFGYCCPALLPRIQRRIDKLRYHMMGSFQIPGWQEAS